MEKENKTKNKYCIYARKSMEAEERQAISIESQLNEMKTIAERDSLSVVEIKTESHSAKNSGERPAS
jgi:DNA invertase Pin-like site-specific DNA recombinase